MNKTVILQFCLCFLCTFSALQISAQEYNSININKYFTPDIVRNSLDINLSLNDNFYNNKSAFDSTSVNFLNWNLTPAFVRYQNTRKCISTLSAGGRTNGDLQKSNQLNNDNFRKYFSTENSLYTNYSTYFFNKKQAFLLFKLNARYVGRYSNSIYATNTGETNNLIKNTSYELKPYVGIGKGRIETVTDARQAVYIIEELSKKGKIKQVLSDKQIFEFAQVISKVKNKRFLDARLRKIEEITTVDSFLLKNNYLTNQDAAYFTTLYDFWENGALYERSSGQSFEINISPNMTFEKTLNKTEILLHGNLESARAYNGDINLVYRFEKSTSLNWQHSFNASLGYVASGFSKEKENDQSNIEKTEGTQTDGILRLSYNLSFYPSTRTRMSLFANHYNKLSVYDHVTINDIAQAKINMNDMNLNTGLSVDYYFSQQLRLSAFTGTNYTFNNNDGDNKQFHIGLGASIIYSFF